MSSEHSKNILLRIMIEIISRGNYAVADELLAADVVPRPLRVGQVPGLEGWKNGLRVVRAGFPDWENIPEQLIGEDDFVAARWTVQGTHLGSFAGIAATGVRITMREMGFFRFAGGKLIEYETLVDELSLLRQLRVVPPAPGVGC